MTIRLLPVSSGINPTANSGAKVKAGDGVCSFTATLSGLRADTPYYVRAYAVNSAGTSYGAEISFTTSAGAPGPRPGPVASTSLAVITSAVTGITPSGATLSGNVISDGVSVTERGFVYGKSSSLSFASGTKVVSGSGNGTFKADLSGLEPDTTYYVCAYALTGAGTAYGAVLSFKTAVVDIPNTGGEGTPWIGMLLCAAAVVLAELTLLKRKSAHHK